jgi:formate dehydrogenase subunit beta
LGEEDLLHAYSLVTRAEEALECDPLFPAMPANGGKAVSRLTLRDAVDRPVAVMMRPCEMRALIELVKLEQAHLENLILIGVVCGGVFQNRSFQAEENVDSLVEGYWAALEKGEQPQAIRPVCSACESFVPQGVDLCWAQSSQGKGWIEATSEKGEEILAKLKLSSAKDVNRGWIDSLREKRLKAREELIAKTKESVSGIENLVSVFGKCIGCHACSHVCPICYCKDCFFESATFEYEPASYERRLDKKGTLRVPMDTVLFHLGRMTHMATSCVGCGMCEDSCPTRIPVAQVFKTVGADLQELFEYLPGRSLQEPLPLTTYREDEFHQIEE